ncbi:MAG: HEAT repeat domain-containing protein [Candidatus Riflebacteria bacterium]
MTTVDQILLVGLIFLVVVVAMRVITGRRKAAEVQPAQEVRQPSPRTDKKEESPISAALNEIGAFDSSPDVSDSEKGTVAAEKAFPKSESKEKIIPADPLVLIKTFSAPPEKRIPAICQAGDQGLVAAVPALIEALYEPDSAISAAAAVALGKIGDPRAIEPLLEISRRNDVQLMKELNENRGVENHEPQSQSPEIEAEAADSPYNFKELVVFKIDQLPKEYFQSDGTPIPRKDLVIRGLKDNNQQLRQMAAKAAIGLENEDVVDPLIEALENPYEVESVRFMAAEALGGMGNEKSTESLLRALKDENVAVRYSAAAALSGRREEGVVMALIGAISDPDKYVRSSVAYALGASGHPSALNVLFDCVSDESEVVSFSAAKAIAAYNSDEIINEVKKRLEFANRKNRIALMEVLGQIKSDESVRILRGFLKSDDSEVSYKASMALMGQENLDILDELIEASKRLDHELVGLIRRNEIVHPEAKKTEKTDAPANSFQRPEVKDERFLHVSENLMKLRDGLQDKNPNIRGSAANALGDSREAVAVEILLAAIEDENEFVRASVISSLGRIGAEMSLKPLLEKAGDFSEEVRYALVKALARFSNESAVLCLKKMAKTDQSSQVRRAARTALDRR